MDKVQCPAIHILFVFTVTCRSLYDFYFNTILFVFLLFVSKIKLIVFLLFSVNCKSSVLFPFLFIE